MIEGISFLGLLAVAIASGCAGISPWWILLPAFIGASANIANGPAYALVMQANQEGRLGTFPVALGSRVAILLALAFVVRWVASWFA